MGLMDRLYRFGSKPYIMDYNGAVNFLGRCVVPIQIGIIAGSAQSKTSSPPSQVFVPIRITKPLNSKFTKIRIYCLTGSDTEFTTSRTRVTDIILKTETETTLISTKTTERWRESNFPAQPYIEGVCLEVNATELTSYNNFYLLSVSIDSSITRKYSQTRLFLEYDNYPTFLNTMENQRFNENKLDDFKFNDILANDMYQMSRRDGIITNMPDYIGLEESTNISTYARKNSFCSSDEFVIDAGSKVSGNYWKAYITNTSKLVGTGLTSSRFIKLPNNYWNVADYEMFFKTNNPFRDIGFYFMLKRFNASNVLQETKYITWDSLFYFNIFNKKTRVISAGDYADNLTLNRAIEAKWNIENEFTIPYDENLNYRQVRPTILYQNTTEETIDGQTQVVISRPDIDFACGNITEIVNNTNFYSDFGLGIAPIYLNGNGSSGLFGKTSTTLFNLPMYFWIK